MKKYYSAIIFLRIAYQQENRASNINDSFFPGIILHAFGNLSSSMFLHHFFCLILFKKHDNSDQL